MIEEREQAAVRDLVELRDDRRVHRGEIHAVDRAVGREHHFGKRAHPLRNHSFERRTRRKLRRGRQAGKPAQDTCRGRRRIVMREASDSRRESGGQEVGRHEVRSIRTTPSPSAKRSRPVLWTARAAWIVLPFTTGAAFVRTELSAGITVNRFSLTTVCRANVVMPPAFTPRPFQE